MSETKERPILFSGPMVRALLSGAKTQTRRVVKPQPEHSQVYDWKGRRLYDGEARVWCWSGHVAEDSWHEITEALAPHCPYGQPGDRLWVRETWGVDDERMKEGIPRVRPEWVTEHDPVLYRADGECCAQIPECACGWTKFRLWRPSIHMPRWASRLTLEITGVRVERVQDISEEDARAEGVEPCGGFMASAGCWTNYGSDGSSFSTARESFFSLWERINGAESLAANSWVWVVEFRRVV